MKQDILNKLNQLFTGTIDRIKVIYYTSQSKEIIRFEILGHQIEEENGMIKIVDDTDNRAFTQKTAIINPSVVESVTYEDDKSEDNMIHRRKVIISMNDKSCVELSTSAMG